MDYKFDTVILADGSFPVHQIPVGLLRNAKKVICCDGSVKNLLEAGMEPSAIVGDLDSVSEEVSERYRNIIYPDYDQETNDLTKAFRWCCERGFRKIAITGATGKREDHTIGNISLLAEYVKEAYVIMVTDTGIFTPFSGSCRIDSFKGQQVSVFSVNPETKITSSGLKYKLKDLKLRNWWMGTLNESDGDFFELKFNGGPVIVFQKFRD